MLIVSDRWTLVKTITSFTVAHSITLAIATLGYASAPLPPLNAAIALSILFLGPEIVRIWRGETSFTIRHPWVVAFAFGLLHGFGFASGLTSMGLPKAEIPLALLLFNVGVEIAQMAFVRSSSCCECSPSGCSRSAGRPGRGRFPATPWARSAPTGRSSARSSCSGVRDEPSRTTPIRGGLRPGVALVGAGARPPRQHQRRRVLRGDDAPADVAGAPAADAGAGSAGEPVREGRGALGVVRRSPGAAGGYRGGEPAPGLRRRSPRESPGARWDWARCWRWARERLGSRYRRSERSRP